jgi:hypothetical protein
LKKIHAHKISYKNGHPKTTYDYENRCHNDNEHSYFSQVAEFIQRLSNTSNDHLKVEDVIVVCNKCDLIPAENLEDAMMSAKEQIMASCQELQSQQIIFLSVKEVTFKLIICLFWFLSVVDFSSGMPVIVVYRKPINSDVS